MNVEPPALREGWFAAWMEETQFLARYPLYAGLLARMEPVATNTVPIMAVCLRCPDDPHSGLQLLVNTRYFEGHPRFREGVLLHEINHVLLGHLTDKKFHSVAYPRIMELAMELSADERIQEPLPENGLEMHHFSRYGIEPGQSTLERYRILAQSHEAGEFKIEDWWTGGMLDTHRPRQSDAGGGAGLGDMLDARSDGASERNWNREEGYGMGSPASAFHLQQMKESIAVFLGGDCSGPDDLQPAKNRHRIAKELQRVLRDSPGRSHINWPEALREAFPRQRQVFPVYVKPNRRFPDRIGEIPGRRRKPPKPELLAGVDTSGSMSGEVLDRIARELRNLAGFARLTVVECDAAVHRIYPMGQRINSFTGGGDTDFAPVFAEADKPRFDGIVYFTDGKADLSQLPAIPTLWVLTNDDPFFPAHGSMIRLL